MVGQASGWQAVPSQAALEGSDMPLLGRIHLWLAFVLGQSEEGSPALAWGCSPPHSGLMWAQPPWLPCCVLSCLSWSLLMLSHVLSQQLRILVFGENCMILESNALLKFKSVLAAAFLSFL